MTESQAYVAFNLTDKIGFATVERLAEECGSVVEAWSRYPHVSARDGGEVDWEREFALADKFGVSIVTPADAEYPTALKTAPGRPLALYVKGSVKALNRTQIAIVGTRRATGYGLSMANRISYDLAQSGVAVTSGLALGIDAEAHRGALSAKGVTIGVIGSGLDRFYPEENRPLAREIAESGGAVVSEFPFGRPADRTTFPIRNHVVAGLCRGIVAIEAPSKSGTLITTSIAADLGKTVMAVPGRADDRMSSGCLQLLRDGAILVRNADDVLDSISELFPAAKRRQPEEAPSVKTDPDQPPYSVEEALVMTNLDEDGVTMDRLVKLTALPVATVNSTVMSLRIKGFVRFLPGNRIAPLRGGA